MRNTEPDISSRSLWSMRLAFFAAQLIVITVLLHRFTSFPTDVAINLVVTSLIMAAAAILLALLAFSQIWYTGLRGTGLALSALIMALLIFVVPLYYLPNLIRLPAINDITTDLLSPPQFQQVAALRDENANSVIYPGSPFISAQAKAYPDIHTLRLKRAKEDSFDLVHRVIEGLGWKIVRDQQPGHQSRAGYIEAVDRSLIMGFRDDIVVRVKGNRHESFIDIRSASRFGRHDLGANAKRIRKVFGIIKTRIARAEAKRIDDLTRQRIARQTALEKKRREQERKRKQRELAKKQGPIILPKANFNQLGVDPDQPNGESLPASGQTGAPYAQFPGISPNPRLNKRQRQKLRRSKRRRKRKKWIPFSPWP